MADLFPEVAKMSEGADRTGDEASSGPRKNCGGEARALARRSVSPAPDSRIEEKNGGDETSARSSKESFRPKKVGAPSASGAEGHKELSYL